MKPTTRDPRTYATAVHFDPPSRTLVLTLADNTRVQVPTALIQGLADATDRELATVETTPSGNLYCPAVDEGFTTSNLVSGRYGTDAWMAALAAGRIGGGKR